MKSSARNLALAIRGWSPTSRVARVLVPPLGALVSGLAELTGRLYVGSWPVLGVSYFDHRFDHLRGPAHWYWGERGIFGARLIREGDHVLDLGCGDGIFSALYFAHRRAYIDAMDRDPRAIALARRRYRRRNVQWLLGDISSQPYPRSDYNVVLLFATLEHFSVAAGVRLLQRIGASMDADGVLLGSTPLCSEIGGHNFEHDNEFFSADYLRGFVEPHFGSVEVWTSLWDRGRVEAYFQCRGPISLSEDEMVEITERLQVARDIGYADLAATTNS